MRGFSCYAACGIFPDQGWNSCLLHWQVGSLPLSYQVSPCFPTFKDNNFIWDHVHQLDPLQCLAFTFQSPSIFPLCQPTLINFFILRMPNSIHPYQSWSYSASQLTISSTLKHPSLPIPWNFTSLVSFLLPCLLYLGLLLDSLPFSFLLLKSVELFQASLQRSFHSIMDDLTHYRLFQFQFSAIKPRIFIIKSGFYPDLKIHIAPWISHESLTANNVQNRTHSF